MDRLVLAVILLFFGFGLIIHRDALARRSAEFNGDLPARDLEARTSFDRFLSLVFGAVTVATGFAILIYG